MNIFDEMRAAVERAKDTLRAADNEAGAMAYLVLGRLRQVKNTDTLKRLKRELQQFDAHTGMWKS